MQNPVQLTNFLELQNLEPDSHPKPTELETLGGGGAQIPVLTGSPGNSYGQ